MCISKLFFYKTKREKYNKVFVEVEEQFEAVDDLLEHLGLETFLDLLSVNPNKSLISDSGDDKSPLSNSLSGAFKETAELMSEYGLQVDPSEVV